MLKASESFARFLSKVVMLAQILAALFFGYLWATRGNSLSLIGSQVPDMEHRYTDDTIIAYAAMAITCALLAVIMFFIRKSARFMRLFAE